MGFGLILSHSFKPSMLVKPILALLYFIYMKELRLPRRTNALVIVAHPDDETIWLGGALKKFKGVNWTIFCLCRASDKDRAPKFKKVCAHFGAKAIMTDLEDEGRLSIQQSLTPIKKLIVKNIKHKKFDYLFTHGANGEYGHERHQAVHLAVKDLVAKKFLKADQTFFFNYKKTDLSPKADSDFVLKLSAKDLAAKQGAMTNIYGFAKNGIDVKYCTKIEALKKLNYDL